MCDLLVDTDTKGLIDNCSEKAMAETYAEVIPEGPTMTFSRNGREAHYSNEVFQDS